MCVRIYMGIIHRHLCGYMKLVCMHACVQVYTCMHVCIHMRVNVCACMCTSVCVRVHS